jgi:hypothetical protein
MASTEENTPSGVAQSDSDPIEMLWHDIRRAVNTRHPKNIAELKQFFAKKNGPKFLLTIVQV